MRTWLWLLWFLVFGSRCKGVDRNIIVIRILHLDFLFRIGCPICTDLSRSLENSCPLVRGGGGWEGCSPPVRKSACKRNFVVQKTGHVAHPSRSTMPVWTLRLPSSSGSGVVTVTALRVSSLRSCHYYYSSGSCSCYYDYSAGAPVASSMDERSTTTSPLLSLACHDGWRGWCVEGDFSCCSTI